MPGTRGPSVGRWGTVDPEIDSSQRWLAAPLLQGGALDPPEGIGVTREGWLASGWCGPTTEGDSHPHGRRAPERSPLRSGQPRSFAFSWKRALGRDPEVVAPDRFDVDYVSTTDQVMLEAQGLLPPERIPAETASRLDNLEALPFEVGSPGGDPALLQWPHEGTTIRCAFSMLPEEHPIGLLRRPLPEWFRPETGLLTGATLGPDRDPVSRPPEGTQTSEEARFGLGCRGSQPARRRVTRERVSLRPPGPDEQVAARPARGW
jgi:hypothetical protein